MEFNGFLLKSLAFQMENRERFYRNNILLNFRFIFFVEMSDRESQIEKKAT